jgi:Na+/H+-translocating membrane pyrophosphatase
MRSSPSAHWLLGSRASHFVIAGAIGIAGLALASHLSRLRPDKRFSGVRGVNEALRIGDAIAIAQGLASGLRASALPLLVIGGSVSAAALVASRSDVPLSGIVGIVLVLAAISCTNPYALALASFGAIADAARGVGSIAPGASSPEAARRAARLDDAGFTGSGVAQSHLFAVAALSAVTAGVAAASPGAESVVNALHPLVLWCGALGFGIALAYAGDTLRHSVTNARGVALEVERQLRAFPRERGRTRVPADFSPSYKACLDLSLSGAFRRVLPTVFAVIATPLAVLVLLRAILTKAEPALAHQSLIALLLVASVSALAFGFAAEGTRLTLAAPRRGARPNTPRADLEAALGCDAFADALGHGAAPAALLAVQACAATVLAAFSLFFP